MYFSIIENNGVELPLNVNFHRYYYRCCRPEIRFDLRMEAEIGDATDIA